MSISYVCPSCGGEHRSRLLALRATYFRDVISQLGDVVERCPATEDWVTVTFEDLRWYEPEPADAARL